MLFSTVESLIKTAMEADQVSTDEQLDKTAEQSEASSEAGLLRELDNALDGDGYGGLEKQASRLGVAKLLVALDILSQVD
jgi:hypothetical protein